MKLVLSILLFLSFLFTSQVQSQGKIVIGTIDSIQSRILHEERTIWVYVPEGASNPIYAKKRYPVLYLLDGDAHFLSVAGMIQQLSSVNGNTVCPEMIVVGIPNTDRTRDLTPSHVGNDLSFIPDQFESTSGGGEAFTAFMEKELIPYIDSVYPTEPYRMLIGHSLGGLMVIHTFLHHTPLFNAYVAIDPSMWWDDQKFLKEAKVALKDNKYPGTTLFLGVANTLPEGLDTTRVKNDTTAATIHIRSNLELIKYLSANRQNKLKVESRYYPDDSHGSVPLIAEYDALHFIFADYPLKLSMALARDTGLILGDKIEKHYKMLSKQMGYDVNPPEDLLNTFGYQALAAKQFTKAGYMFKLNVRYYPESFNVYDSLGDYFNAIGDKNHAMDNYKKALSLHEYPETREKLMLLERT